LRSVATTVDVCIWFWYSSTRKASQEPHMPSTFGRFRALHTVASSFVSDAMGRNRVSASSSVVKPGL